VHEYTLKKETETLISFSDGKKAGFESPALRPAQRDHPEFPFPHWIPISSGNLTGEPNPDPQAFGLQDLESSQPTMQ
jgi:hypothetical protein